MNRLICAFCVLSQTVSLPPTQLAATARPSIGTGARRWLTMSWRSTTSQPSNALSSAGAPMATAMFESVPGNSSVPVPATASNPITGGSGV
jgi:hypothetical protein